MDIDNPTRVELNTLIDRLIFIKDHYDLSRSDVDSINDACNVIEHHMSEIAIDTK